MSKNNFSIPVRWNSENKFCVATVHYSADPNKDKQWVNEAKKGMSDEQWEREYEISYDLYAGKPVYPQFTQEHIQSFDWVHRGNSYVMRGWDFGFHRPAVLFGYFNKFDQLCFRHEIMGHDEVIKEFAKRVIMFSRSEFPGAKFIDCGDPAGNQANSQTKESDVEVLRGLGIEFTSKASSINEGLEIMRQRMLRRNDGKLGMLVHPDCQIFIDGLKGGYRYPEIKRGKAEKEKPLKDGYYDHLQDCARMICVNNLEVANTTGSTRHTSRENKIMKADKASINDYF